MIEALIAYYSRTGTTERMAKEVAEGMRGSEVDADVDLKKVGDIDVENLPKYDVILLGSPTYYGNPAAEVKKLIDESIAVHGELDGKVGGAFVSSGDPAGGNETTMIALLETLLVHGMVVKGTSGGNHYGPVVIGEPEEEELKECRMLGKRVLKLAEKIKRK